MDPVERSTRAGVVYARWGRSVAGHPWLALGVAVAVWTVCIAGIGRLEFALSIEDLLLEDDPARIVYDDLRRHFESDETLLVLARGDVFSPTFLERLTSLHRALEERIEYAKRVDSLVDARVTRAVGDGLAIDEWLALEPTDPIERERWVEDALANPAYRDLLVAADGRTAAVVVVVERPAAARPDTDVLAGFEPMDAADARPGTQWLTPTDIERLMRSVDAIAADHRAPGFEIHVTGGPAMTDAVSHALEHDMGVFTAGSILVIGVLLFALFGRLSGVLVPLVTAVVPMVATFGLMGWLGLPVTPTTQLVPSLMIAIGVAQSVHLLTAFYRAYDAGEARIDAIAHAFGETGLAVSLATITTALGLGSFVAASLTMLVGLGLAAALGVILIFASGFVVMPALLVLLPLRRSAATPGLRAVLDRAVVGIGAHAMRHPGWVTGGWTLCLAVGAVLAGMLHVRNDALGWFPDDHPFVADTRVANDGLGGAFAITVAIDSGRPGGLLEPSLLEAIDAFDRRATALEAGGFRAGASVSLVGIVKETHRALMGGSPDAWSIPVSRETVAQEILLFETAGPEELETVVDPNFRMARYTLMVPIVDNRAYLPFAAALQREADAALPGVDVTLTGIPLLSARSNEVMLGGLLRSYTLALVLIAPLLMLIVGSFRIGLLGLIPNLAPIIIGLGAMSLLDIDLDGFTALIASIAIGLAVDDTIHFLHGWSKARARLGSHERAVAHTLRTTGSALVVTSTALALGFAVFMVAGMVNVANLGLVTALVVGIALLADVQLCPALLSLSTLGEVPEHRPETLPVGGSIA